MENKKLIDLYAVAFQLQTQNPSWRKGQALFNAMLITMPGIAEKVRATQYDPFHQDSRIEECIKYITGFNDVTIIPPVSTESKPN